MEKYNAKVSIHINAKPEIVWKALTDPELIKQYLFGTTVTTDWQEGSPITYTGEWKGQTYQDKGKILEVIPNKLLASTYWSAFSSLADSPENYQRVTYQLDETATGTKLTLIQEDILSEEGAKESKENWTSVLESMKNLIERL